MSDMEETEGHVGPAAPHRVIGTPPPSPRLLGPTALADGGDGEVAEAEGAEHIVGLPPDDPRVIVHARRVEKIVATCFILAFIAGCGNNRSRTAMSNDELRRKNDRLRERIEHVLKLHPELRDVTDVIAFRQELYVQVGTPFLERIHGKLQERARAIIDRRPDLEHHFED